MSTWDRRAADAAADYAAPRMRPVQTMSDHMADAFHDGARWQREALLSDETILRALNAEEPRAATDNLADWGEQSIARMRRALAAATGEEA